MKQYTTQKVDEVLASYKKSGGQVMNPTIQALFSSSLNLEEKTEGRVEVNITSNCIMLYGRPYGQNMEYY